MDSALSKDPTEEIAGSSISWRFGPFSRKQRKKKKKKKKKTKDEGDNNDGDDGSKKTEKEINQQKKPKKEQNTFLSKSSNTVLQSSDTKMNRSSSDSQSSISIIGKSSLSINSSPSMLEHNNRRNVKKKLLKFSNFTFKKSASKISVGHTVVDEQIKSQHQCTIKVTGDSDSSDDRIGSTTATISDYHSFDKTIQEKESEETEDLDANIIKTVTEILNSGEKNVANINANRNDNDVNTSNHQRSNTLVQVCKRVQKETLGCAQEKIVHEITQECPVIEKSADNNDLRTVESKDKRNLTYKIILVGQVETGKTSIVNRYTHNLFSAEYQMTTIGVDCSVKTISWDHNTTITLQLWDTAGQEHFMGLLKAYYKEANGVLIVFDCTNPNSLITAGKWKTHVDATMRMTNGKIAPCILLANKCDRTQNYDYSEVEEFCKVNKFSAWFKTSAKNDKNIDEAMRCLIDKILHGEQEVDEESNVHDEPDSQCIVLGENKLEKSNNDDQLKKKCTSSKIMAFEKTFTFDT